MTRILKNKPMFYALLLASLCQMFAIVSDQYVLHLDFQIERLGQNITSTKSLQKDLKNTVKVLRHAARYRDSVWLEESFNQKVGLNSINEIKQIEVQKNLKFMMQEVEEVFKIHSTLPSSITDEVNSLGNDSYDIYKFAEPLYEKIVQSNSRHLMLSQVQEKKEDQRHLLIIFAIISQMLSLLSLLWFFIIELREPSTEI